MLSRVVSFPITRIFLLALFFVLLNFFSVSSQTCNSGCTIVVNASNAGLPASITTVSNTTLCIQASTSRSITISGNNVTLCIATGAVLGSAISFSSATNVTINNSGTFNSTLSNFPGGTINNNNTWNGSLNTFTTGTVNNAGAWNGTITNFNGGSFNNNSLGSFNTNLSLNNTATFNNNSGSSFTTNATTISINGSSVFNNFTSFTKPFTLNGGTFNNLSTGTVTTNLTFAGGTLTNAGSATFTNSSLDIVGTLTSSPNSTLRFNGNVDISNSSSLLVSNNVAFQISGNLNNSRTFSTQSNVTIGGSFTNNNGATTTITNVGLTVNGATNNNGILTLSNAGLTARSGLTNHANSTINLSNSVVDVVGNFTNNGTVNSSGSSCSAVKVTGISANNTSGIFGTTGGPLTDICTGLSGGFNVNTGSLRNTSVCSCNINPLPVTFISFRGKVLGRTVVLEWQTSSEENNRAFIIERSVDGKAFEPIAEVAGKGNTHQISTYQLTDNSLLTGINYYRIRQIDFDNTQAYHSKVIALQIEAGNHLATLAPNPSQTDKISVYLAKATQKLNISITDMKGSIRFSHTYSHPEAENDLWISNLEKGLYFVIIRMDDTTQTLRLVRL